MILSIINLLDILFRISNIRSIVYTFLPFIFVILFEAIVCIILLCYIEKLRQNNKNLELSNATLTDLCDDMRAFKHDFNNILQSIGGYVETADLFGLKNYYIDLIKDCYHISNLECLNSSLVRNASVRSILISKYYKSKEKNIQFHFDINIELSNLNISNYELSRILGILLDNSIEAAQEYNDKIIIFRYYNDYTNNRDLIIIENTYLDKTIDTIKIFEKSYSTKRNNTGLGLWEINRILNKHTNLNLFTYKNDKFFVQQLEIYKD